MEERKTTAWVVVTLAFIIIFLTAILPQLKYRGTRTIAFKNCVVHFKFYNQALGLDIYRANQNRLALCLCRIYKKDPDTATANRIIKIYKEYHKYNGYDSFIVNSNYCLDSIIKYKRAVFDTIVAEE
ncbi:MAG TPA: hypothetical protein VGG71_04795 [Chitinophagaceae bacterium]|jgi:hypothetical protein